MPLGLLAGALVLVWGLVHLRLSVGAAETEAWRTQLRRAYLLFAGAGALVVLTLVVAH